MSTDYLAIVALRACALDVITMHIYPSLLGIMDPIQIDIAKSWKQNLDCIGGDGIVAIRKSRYSCSISKAFDCSGIDILNR